MGRVPKIGDKIMVPNLGEGCISRIDDSQIFVLLNDFGFEVPIIKDVIVFIEEEHDDQSTMEEVKTGGDLENIPIPIVDINVPDDMTHLNNNIHLIMKAMRMLD